MPHRLAPHPAPARDFNTALAGFAAMHAGELQLPLALGCGSSLLHHDAPTERALVLLHGYTNCPRQMRGIADLAYSEGVTVLTPLAPSHGRQDRDPSELAQLSAPEIVAHIDRAVDIAAGLGDRVSILGFSFGGVCAAWAARNRNEVAEAMLVSPSFAPRGTPRWAVPLLPLWSRLLPERLMWWDPIRKDGYAGSPYGYPRFSRTGIGSVFDLGVDATSGPARRTTSLERAILVLNGADPAISPSAARHGFSRGLMTLADDAEIHRFRTGLRYPHDLVDPEGLNAARAPEVWPQLLSLLRQSGARDQ